MSISYYYRHAIRKNERPTINKISKNLGFISLFYPRHILGHTCHNNTHISINAIICNIRIVFFCCSAIQFQIYFSTLYWEIYIDIIWEEENLDHYQFCGSKFDAVYGNALYWINRERSTETSFSANWCHIYGITWGYQYRCIGS